MCVSGGMDNGAGPLARVCVCVRASARANI